MKQGIFILLIVLLAQPLLSQSRGSSNLDSTQTHLDHYQFDGEFYFSNPIAPYLSNPIYPFDLYVDPTGNASIEEIYQKRETLVWGDRQSILPEKGNVYWLKTRLYGNSVFRGTQTLYVSANAGNDISSFDYVDVYTFDGAGGFVHQQTGDQVPLKKRPYDFWITFFKVNLEANDTLDLYIRMEGAASYNPKPGFNLWHIDTSSVFPRQVNEAWKNGLFYGILGIQCLYFLLLYFIERERIHLYFVAFVFGTLLTGAFVVNNFSSYEPFPSLRDYHIHLYFLGVFIFIVGILKFTETYFNYQKTSFYSKWILPAFFTISAIFYLNHTFEIIFPPTFQRTSLLLSYLFHLLSIVLALIMVIVAPPQKNVSKLFFMAAFFPLLAALIYILGLYVVHFLGLTPFPDNALVLYMIDLAKLAFVALLTLLALSIGYRTNILKKEKEAALKQNLDNQQTIIEAQIKADNLLEINQLKTRLYTNITHEFRTPLTIIMGINEELSNKHKQHTEDHELIKRNGENLLRLINQMLDLSKADSGLLQLNLVQADIIPYLNYLTESFYSKAQDKNIRLVFYAEVKELIMDFDEIKIQHIVYNLLSNALKFTPKKGKIIFHAHQVIESGAPFLKMMINDNGVGIPKDKLSNIFNRFYQVDSTDTRRSEGTGIGLALTKELVGLMKGNISADSELGKGTTITIHIPINNKATLTQLNIEHSESTSKVSETQDSKPENALVENKDNDLPLLLFIEDNRDITLYLKRILQDKYQVETAENGVDGIQKAYDIIPDIIISDVMMPQKDGFEVTKILKHDTRTSHIPIILLTAKANVEDKIEGIKTGADAYLMKPFNKTELLIRIEQLLALRKSLQVHYSASTSLHKSNKDNVPSSSKPSLDDLFIQKLRETVLNSIDDNDLNGESLCEVAGLSQSQLYRKLKALTNETPNALIRNVRLEKSLELLENTDLNISEIAYAVGFNDPNYFSRAFHKRYDKTPSTYRTKN